MNKTRKMHEQRGLIRRLKKHLSYENGEKKPIDPGEPGYPNARGVAVCLRNSSDDLLTEARFVLWQNRRIKELEKLLKEKK